MTRRICAMAHNGKFLISQEFNGDRREQELFSGFGMAVTCHGAWDDLIPTFDGNTTPEHFASAVRSMENAYQYGQEPLEEVEELPDCEEVWMLVSGKLVLYSRYGKLVEQEEKQPPYVLLQNRSAKPAQVRSRLLNELTTDPAASQAYRTSYIVPAFFYRDKTVEEACGQLKKLAQLSDVELERVCADICAKQQEEFNQNHKEN